MMHKTHIYIVLLSALFVVACANDDIASQDMQSPAPANPHELTGIHAVVAGTEPATRAGSVTTLQDYVGRSEFNSGDKVVFTDIHRTNSPLESFTYPGADSYEGITFEAGSEAAWVRDGSIGPERVYWTDAESVHTFVAYGTPQDATYDWKKYTPTAGSSKNWYLGSLGDPTVPGIGEPGYNSATNIIDYYLTPEEQADYTTTKNNVTTYSNPLIDKEDLLLAYDTQMKAEPGGSVALVKFYHGLSSIRVVVNISGFSASSEAADNQTTVSNMRLLHQPTMYIWMQEGTDAQALRAETRDGTSTDQDILDELWTGTTPVPRYNQRKDIRLWIPEPKGRGANQNKTFTFYGITVPQPSSYVSTLGSEDPYRTVELQFDVTYPNPMNPTAMQTKTYTASLPYGETYSDGDDETSDKGVHFEAGYNTTINISLNHKNEEMTVGAEYENWNFVATPDQGRLKMNSTFMKDVLSTSVTIADDAKATIDDATWLYKVNGDNANVKDIYDHTGNTSADAYQISTAYQLLSFAYEVKSGRTFKDKYVRLDADLTLQASSDLTSPEIMPTGEDNQDFSGADLIEWIGVGASDRPFEGTFIGGNRYINRLYGKPLFVKLGEHAKIEQLNISAIPINYTGGTVTTAIDGGGLFAESNAGRICACRVVGDVVLSSETAGAFVGSNSGQLFASYHIGDTKNMADAAATGGLVGSNSGIISSCYHVGTVTGATTGGVVASNSGTLYNNYYCSTLFASPTYTPESGVTGETSSNMTKQSFVTTINSGIADWCGSHSGYDNHSYEYQPANYPRLAQ